MFNKKSEVGTGIVAIGLFLLVLYIINTQLSQNIVYFYQEGFSPKELNLDVGETFTVINKDSIQHIFMTNGIESSYISPNDKLTYQANSKGVTHMMPKDNPHFNLTIIIS